MLQHLDILHIRNLVVDEGVEPPTLPLSRERTANCANQPFYTNRSFLPLCYISRGFRPQLCLVRVKFILAEEEGVEPPCSGSKPDIIDRYMTPQ